MSGTDVKPNPDKRQQAAKLAPPRASHWLWRPWYAKAWWLTSVAFWLAAFGTPQMAIDPKILLSASILFHPFLMVPLLGFGFFQAWIRFHFISDTGWINSQDSCDVFSADGEPFRSTDPTNPANSRYYWHPGNPGSEAWRNEHVRGIR